MTGRPLLSIQYLRAIAALMVLAYHACRWVGPGFNVGAAGVDVFFVISGFILWTVAAERPGTPAKFLAHRAVRVVPLYWIATLLVTAGALLAPAVFDAKPTWPHVLMSLGFIPHLNARGEPFPLIQPGWSLNYEALFYLIFAATLFAKREHRFWWLGIGLVAVPTFGLIVKPAYFLGFNLMFLQFLAGAWLAERRQAGKFGTRAMGAFLVTFGAVAFGALTFFDLFEAYLRPLWWGAPAVALVAGLVMIEDTGGIASVAWLRRLGDASYSIYLTHVIVTEILAKGINASKPVFILAAVVASLAAGLACHYLIERPLLGLFRRQPSPALPSNAI